MSLGHRRLSPSGRPVASSTVIRLFRQSSIHAGRTNGARATPTATRRDGKAILVLADVCARPRIDRSRRIATSISRPPTTLSGPDITQLGREAKYYTTTSKYSTLASSINSTSHDLQATSRRHVTISRRIASLSERTSNEISSVLRRA